MGDRLKDAPHILQNLLERDVLSRVQAREMLAPLIGLEKANAVLTVDVQIRCGTDKGAGLDTIAEALGFSIRARDLVPGPRRNALARRFRRAGCPLLASDLTMHGRGWDEALWCWTEERRERFRETMRVYLAALLAEVPRG